MNTIDKSPIANQIIKTMEEKLLERIAIGVEAIAGSMTQKSDTNNVVAAPSGAITIVEQDGKKYVRLCVGSYDINIDLHDAEKEMTWDDAKKYCEDKGMRLPDFDELHLIYALRKDINKVLVEAGGEPLKEDIYWSGTENYRSTARYVYFYGGYAGSNIKCSGYTVRPVAASKPCA